MLLVGAASSREGQSSFVAWNRGWKPLPQQIKLENSFKFQTFRIRLD
jgi:hypothetical protein